MRIYVGQHVAALGDAHPTRPGARESRGTSVYYRIADDSVYVLCDLVCGNIVRQLERTSLEREVFVRRVKRAATAARRNKAK